MTAAGNSITVLEILGGVLEQPPTDAVELEALLLCCKRAVQTLTDDESEVRGERSLGWRLAVVCGVQCYFGLQACCQSKPQP